MYGGFTHPEVSMPYPHVEHCHMRAIKTPLSLELGVTIILANDMQEAGRQTLRNTDDDSRMPGRTPPTCV